MCNLPLLIQIREKLDGFGINSTLGKTPKNLRITIYTEENVKIFIKEIGFSNPKHLEKLHLAHLI